MHTDPKSLSQDTPMASNIRSCCRFALYGFIPAAPTSSRVPNHPMTRWQASGADGPTPRL